jgi:hypothetical protein
MGQETPHWRVPVASIGTSRSIAALHSICGTETAWVNVRMLASGTVTRSLNGSARSREIGTPCAKVKSQAKIARLQFLPVWY